MEGIEQSFKWAVQALAQPADVQPTLFPEFVVVADELAIDFGHWWEVYESRFGHLLSAEQHEKADMLNSMLVEMSGPGKPELWTDEGCLNHPKWSDVRQLATDVLSSFEWPLIRPPSTRSLYAQYSPKTELRPNE